MIINVLLAILLLSIIIVAHEFGHFIIAKANGVCVVEFSIGFGPRIFAFRIGDTDYCLKMLPFGGSCRMLGENDEYDEDTLDEDAFSELPAVERRSREMLAKYGAGRTLESKSVSARIAIMAAGPVFNFIFALLLSIILIGISGYDPCVVDGVAKDSPAYSAGLQEGDLITSVNGRNINFTREFAFYRTYHESENMHITYLRDGTKYVADINPEIKTENAYKIGIKFSDDMRIAELVEDSPAKNGGLKENDKLLSVNDTALTKQSDLTEIVEASEGKPLTFTVERTGRTRSFQISPEYMETTSYYTGLICYGNRVQASPLQSIGYAFFDTWYRMSSVIELLFRMVTGRMSINNLSGPVGTVSAISTVVEDSKSDGLFYVFLNILNLGIMLSANLGIMNLLPVPALDGGRLIVYIIEAIRGKTVHQRTEAVINFIGVVLLLVLTGFILVKDIMSLF